MVAAEFEKTKARVGGAPSSSFLNLCQTSSLLRYFPDSLGESVEEHTSQGLVDPIDDPHAPAVVASVVKSLADVEVAVDGCFVCVRLSRHFASDVTPQLYIFYGSVCWFTLRSTTRNPAMAVWIPLLQEFVGFELACFSTSGDSIGQRVQAISPATAEAASADGTTHQGGLRFDRTSALADVHDVVASSFVPPSNRVEDDILGYPEGGVALENVRCFPPPALAVDKASQDSRKQDVQQQALTSDWLARQHQAGLAGVA